TKKRPAVEKQLQSTLICIMQRYPKLFEDDGNFFLRSKGNHLLMKQKEFDSSMCKNSLIINIDLERSRKWIAGQQHARQ
ncbi:hypothetical protein QYM36_004860, partial [Artemia franciscana]